MAVANLPIGIDAHMVGTHETGNETYIVQLSAALARLGGHTYNLYTPDPGAIPDEIRSHANVAVRSFRKVPSVVRIPLLYPRLARRDHLACCI